MVCEQRVCESTQATAEKAEIETGGTDRSAASLYCILATAEATYCLVEQSGKKALVTILEVCPLVTLLFGRK